MAVHAPPAAQVSVQAKKAPPAWHAEYTCDRSQVERATCATTVPNI